MKPSKQRLYGVPNTNYSFAEVINKAMDGAIPFSHGPDQLMPPSLFRQDGIHTARWINVMTARCQNAVSIVHDA